MNPFLDLTLPASYFSQPDRVLIFHIAKTGGTSLLRRILAAHGQDPDALARDSAHAEVSWDQALWDHAHSVLLSSVSAELRRSYLSDESIQKVAFVREPAARLWSAWVQKILVGEPFYAELRDFLYGAFDPKGINIGTSRADLEERFSAFVEWLPHSRIYCEDGHFMSQALLLEGAPGDTQFLNSAEMDQHLHRLAPHLAGASVRERLNATQELVCGPVMTLRTYGTIRRLYSDDYSMWGRRLSWQYRNDWAVQSSTEASPVSVVLFERARAARRLANLWAVMEELRSERDAALEESVQAARHLEAMLASRTWRWATLLRQAITWPTRSHR